MDHYLDSKCCAPVETAVMRLTTSAGYVVDGQPVPLVDLLEQLDNMEDDPTWNARRQSEDLLFVVRPGTGRWEKPADVLMTFEIIR